METISKKRKLALTGVTATQGGKRKHVYSCSLSATGTGLSLRVWFTQGDTKSTEIVIHIPISEFLKLDTLKYKVIKFLGYKERRQ